MTLPPGLQAVRDNPPDVPLVLRLLDLTETLAGALEEHECSGAVFLPCDKSNRHCRARAALDKYRRFK